jgi:MerR family transcriptional regulator, repressor of the yfmOP operon
VGRNAVIDRPAQFRIGELARRVGVTPRAVRYYEELGLLPDRGRTDGSHRFYDEQDESRLSDLLQIRDLLGLSLTELREWMEAEDARARLRERWRAHPGPDDETRAAIIREAISHMDMQLSVVRARRAALEELEDQLTSTRRRVRGMLAEIEQART